MRSALFITFLVAFLAFGVSFLCFWFYLAFGKARSALRGTSPWEEAAARLGLQARGQCLDGRLGELDVHAELAQDASSRALFGETRIRVTAFRSPPPEVVALVLPLLHLEPPPPGVLPLQPIGSGLSQAVVSEVASGAELVRHVERVVRAVEALGTAPIAQLLAANLAVGCPPGIRIKSLEALLTHYGRAEETARVLHACIADHDPDVRYLAAQETGPSAMESLAVDPRVPAQLRLRALEHLEPRIPYQRFSPVLAKTLELPGDEPQARALSVVASRRDKAHAGRIREMAASRHLTAPVAAALAEALVSLGERSEPAMIGLLESSSESAQAIAIRELREWGTVRAVEPLLQVQGRSAIEEAARSAARAIQSRLAGAEAGGVSVVESVELGGGVSLAPVREKKE